MTSKAGKIPTISVVVYLNLEIKALAFIVNTTKLDRSCSQQGGCGSLPDTFHQTSTLLCSNKHISSFAHKGVGSNSAAPTELTDPEFSAPVLPG